MNRELKTTENIILNQHIFKDEDILCLFNKVQKIGSATYLLTKYFPDQEPLKWSLRQNINEIIKDVLNQDFLEEIPKNNFYTKTIIRLQGMLCLYETAYFSDYLNEINFKIICDEIKKTIEKTESFYLNEDQKNQLSNISFIKDNLEYKGHDVFYNHNNMSFIEKEEKKEHKEINFLKKSQNQENKQKPDRTYKILDFIKEKGIVSIKDISNSIKGCSEKTIQRELLSLIEDGLIIREGERRWSKYILAKKTLGS